MVALQQRHLSVTAAYDTIYGGVNLGADPLAQDATLKFPGGGVGFWNCLRLYPVAGVGAVVMGNATSLDHGAIATRQSTRRPGRPRSRCFATMSQSARPIPCGRSSPKASSKYPVGRARVSKRARVCPGPVMRRTVVPARAWPTVRICP